MFNVEYIKPKFHGTGIPSPSRYRELIERQALAANLPVDKILSWNHKTAIYRWRVWRDLYACGYSLPGIGRTAGRDHTTILLGIRKATAMDSLAYRG